MIGGGIGSSHGSVGFSLGEDFNNAVSMTGYFYNSVSMIGYIKP